jgi:hypothetical protein
VCTFTVLRVAHSQTPSATAGLNYLVNRQSDQASYAASALAVSLGGVSCRYLAGFVLCLRLPDN